MFAEGDNIPGPAHPRVSGENFASSGVPFCAMGSSPRERGKREVGSRSITVAGLIPA